MGACCVLRPPASPATVPPQPPCGQPELCFYQGLLCTHLTAVKRIAPETHEQTKPCVEAGVGTQDSPTAWRRTVRYIIKTEDMGRRSVVVELFDGRDPWFSSSYYLRAVKDYQSQF